jgi:ABC-type multidrug transport system permease subunit
MAKIFMDSYSVLWADLRFLRRQWWRTLSMSLMSPILYLLAFGWGLGRGIHVEGVSYLEFVIPGIIALTGMTSSFNGAGMKLNVDRLFYKCFDECLMSPISPLSLIIGKALIGVVRGLISSVAFLIIGLIISPALTISPLFAMTLVLNCFVFAFFGVFAALLAKSHQDMATFSSVVLLPMTFLGGTFFSLSQLPQVLKVILYLIPLTHSSQCLRAVTQGHAFPWLSLAAIAGFGLAFFLGCLLVLRRASV